MLPKVQKIKKKFDNRRDIAYTYFSLMSVFNNLKLTNKELQLLAYIAANGHIGSENNRRDFLKTSDATIFTLNNTISKLYKKKILYKVEGKIRINPAFKIDFEEDRPEYTFAFICLLQKELKTESTK
jgi:hypothetical protein